jgi:hypothetical protein
MGCSQKEFLWRRGPGRGTQPTKRFTLFPSLPKEFSLSKQAADMRARFQPILAIDKDNVGLPMLCLFLIHPAECRDNDLVARLNLASGSTVDRYGPASSWS